MHEYNQWTFKVLSTLGIVVNLLLLDIPKDLIRWLGMKPKNVEGKVIVITGGGSGLGQCMAQILAVKKKAKVAVIDVNEKGGHETIESVQKEGGEAAFWRCDISNVDELNETAKKIEEHYGKVDIVICNAAVLYFAFFMELSSKQLQTAVNVNIVGTINTIRAFLGAMEDRNDGHIVAVSSIAGWAGETYGLAYCPTKFAVRGAMECLQMELRDRGLNGIKCTTVCPYFARTPMVLNVGMRPTSTWLPFMSVKSCSLRIVDAVLKEKVMYFMPNYGHLVPFIKGFLSVNCAKSLRDYLNCRYEPSENATVNSKTRRLLPVMPDYFRMPHILWWIVIVFGLAMNFLAYYKYQVLDTPFLPVIGPFASRVGRDYPTLVLLTNLFALVAHIGEAIYALVLTEKLRYTFSCRFLWFVQTLILGFPSLSILKKKVRDASKQQ